MTSTPTKSTTVEGEVVRLETIPEIITKKIYHRGSSIQPRDIFDIAAGGDAHAASIIRELKPYKDKVTKTLSVMERLNPDFANKAIADLAIKPKYKTISKTAIERAKEILRAV